MTSIVVTGCRSNRDVWVEIAINDFQCARGSLEWHGNRLLSPPPVGADRSDRSTIKPAQAEDANLKSASDAAQGQPVTDQDPVRRGRDRIRPKKRGNRIGCPFLLLGTQQITSGCVRRRGHHVRHHHHRHRASP
jgi:hypothetical protein